MVENNKRFKMHFRVTIGASLRYDEPGLNCIGIARSVSCRIYLQSYTILVCYVLHLEQETELECQLWSQTEQKMTHILDCQFTKCCVGVIRQRCFRHCQFLLLQLDNLYVSDYSTSRTERREPRTRSKEYNSPDPR